MEPVPLPPLSPAFHGAATRVLNPGDRCYLGFDMLEGRVTRVRYTTRDDLAEQQIARGDLRLVRVDLVLGDGRTVTGVPGPDVYGPHAGSHLRNRTVSFLLRHSDQATVFNKERHGEPLTGPVLVAWDDFIAVRVDGGGWRFAHTVPVSAVFAIDGQDIPIHPHFRRQRDDDQPGQ